MLRLISLACVATLAVGAGAPHRETVHVAGPSVHQDETAKLTDSSCPAQMLPDGDACVHLPGVDVGAPEAEPVQNAHRDWRGEWTPYDEIPRRPDRPADYDLYRFPVPCEHGCVASGYDLDRPDDQQRRTRPRPGGAIGRWGRAEIGHGAVDLPQKRGTPIAMVRLEHQEGDAQVVYAGPLFGTTVVTRHTLREGGQVRDYLLLFGHLDAQAAGVRAGAVLKEGDLVGFVGDTGSPQVVHLHLEARRVRSGVTLDGLTPSALVANDSSVACDPRNVLPLKSQSRR